MGRERNVLLVFCVIVLIAFFLRFFLLDLRSLQHDEANHWLFFINKIYSGKPLVFYPSFHGFASWYISAIPLFFVGVSVFALRFMVALFGALAVALLFPLRKHLGDFGLLFSALFLAVSPTMVYYSRFVSQHTFFVFFSLLSFVCIVKYFERFQNKYLYLTTVSLALLYTTHDLAIVFFAIGASFLFFLYYFDFSGFLFKNRLKLIYSKIDKKALWLSIFFFLFVVVTVMSSFFTNFANLSEFIGSLDFQFYNSYASGQSKPFFYYLFTFFPIELPVFLGSVLSIFFLKRNHFFVFVSYWALASFFIFSMIPHKLPWIFTIVLLPMFILSGLAIDAVFSKAKKIRWLSRMTLFIIFVFFAISLFVSIDLNFVHYASKENALNYLGPTEDVFKMLQDFQAYLNGNNHKILVTATVYRPLYFYFRENNAVFLEDAGKINPTDYPDYDMFVADKGQIDQKEADASSNIKEYEVFKGYHITVLYTKGFAQ